MNGHMLCKKNYLMELKKDTVSMQFEVVKLGILRFWLLRELLKWPPILLGV